MSRFAKCLLAIVVVALGVRVGYVVLDKWEERPVGDEVYYTAQANAFARGSGFTFVRGSGFLAVRDGDEAADHPPLTELALAPVSWFADRVSDDPLSNIRAHRLTMAVLGVGVVVLIALLGRMIAGERVGLIAGGIAALYPNLWMNDALIMSETLTALTVTLAIILGYRFLRRPSWGTAAWLGVACGLAMLVRAELGLLLPLMVLPLVFRLVGHSARDRVRLAALVLAMAAVVIAPWLVANLTRFEEPVFLSSNDGLTIYGANHPDTYHGSGTGLWTLDSTFLHTPKGDRSVASKYLRDLGLDYAADHLDRVPIVMLARVGRVWSVYAPGQMASYNVGEGREEWVSWLGFATFWILVPLAIVGARNLRRHRTPLWPLVAQMVLVTVTATLVYGLVRFRVPAEVAIVVLAAVGIEGIQRGGGADTSASSVPEAGVTVRS